MSDPELLQDEPQLVEIISSERVFDGMVWNIQREKFEYGGEEITREFIDHTGAVAVLVIDDDKRVLLIRQYRHAVRSREWELPAGLLDIDGEDPLEAAKRELAEEVDLEATEWSLLTRFCTSPGGSNEQLTVYRASGLSRLAAFDRTAEEADIEQRWVPLNDAVRAVLDGRVRNSILIIAVLTAHAQLA